MLILLNKPFKVLCRFTGPAGQPNLSKFLSIPDVYPAGRLDQDSEGLLLLTDNGRLQNRISNPDSGLWKTYWVQVEGVPAAQALARLREGVMLKDGPTRRAKAERMDEPAELWPRMPPIRERRDIPTSWICLSLHEGRNRQVRRMTAAVGHPTLRLIRYAIGGATLEGLAPGEWRYEDVTVLFPEDRTRSMKPFQRRGP